MKVGDLVKLKRHCKQSGRLAIVVSDAIYENGYCYIAFMDEPLRKILASLNNLEAIHGDKKG